MATKSVKGSCRKPTLSIVSATPAGVEGPPDGAATTFRSETDSRHALIERAAYLRAERRGFGPGQELDDWCAAEREIDDQLFRGEITVP